MIVALRSGNCNCGDSLRVAMLLAMLPTGALASDWYTGASPQAGQDWVVTLDASTTVTSTGSAFAHAGATTALGGTLAETGARARVEALIGTYEYRATTGRKITADQAEGAVLVGYEWVWRNAKLAGFVGLSVRNNTLSFPDPSNQVVGTSYGVKGALDLFVRPSDRTMLQAYGSFSTNDKAYFARLKGGYRIDHQLYVGPEIAFLGNAFYSQFRIGAHLSGLELGPVQVSVSAGYLNDRDQGHGAYGSFDLRAQF